MKHNTGVSTVSTSERRLPVSLDEREIHWSVEGDAEIVTNAIKSGTCTARTCKWW